MKKIITIILAIACAFTLFSCGDGGNATDDSIDAINSMYNAISPSRVEVTTTQTFGKYTLTTSQILKTGVVDGVAVTSFEETKDRFRDIESGAGSEIVGAIETVSSSWMFHEELGYRENGGKWDPWVDDPTPKTGAIALNITSDIVENYEDDEEKKTVTFSVLPENTEEVFGYEIPAEVSVTIVHSGADIVSVRIVYSEINEEEDDHPQIDVVIEAKYSYVAQQITID